jgi:hypothetical protein
MISEKSIAKFKQVYQDTYGIELNPEDAHRLATEIITLYQAVYGDVLFNYKTNKNNNV